MQELSIVPFSCIADHELVISDLDYVKTVEEPILRYLRDFQPALEVKLSQVSPVNMRKLCLLSVRILLN
jgi:hypothetical protein